MNVNKPLEKTRHEFMMKIVALNILVPLILFAISYASFVYITKKNVDLMSRSIAQENAEIFKEKGKLVLKDQSADAMGANSKVVYYDTLGNIINNEIYGYYGKDVPASLMGINNIIEDGSTKYYIEKFSITWQNEIGATYCAYFYDGTILLKKYNANSISIALIILLTLFAVQSILTMISAKLLIDPLNKSSERNNNLISDISHEFNTPLSIISANVSNALTQPDATVSQVSDYLSSTLDCVSGLKRMVKDMLFLSRSDMDKVAVELKKCNLSKIIEEMVEPFQLMSQMADKDMIVAIDPDIIMLADADKIKQLAIIMLDNANKYTRVGDTIKFELIDGGSKVYLKVSDTGIGVAPENIKKVFERFFREDKARLNDKKVGGTGLGLSIAKAIVDSLGGKIKVSSNIPKGFIIEAEFKRLM